MPLDSFHTCTFVLPLTIVTSVLPSQQQLVRFKFLVRFLFLDHVLQYRRHAEGAEDCRDGGKRRTKRRARQNRGPVSGSSSRSWHERVTQVSTDVRTGVLCCSLQILIFLEDAVEAPRSSAGVTQPSRSAQDRTE